MAPGTASGLRMSPLSSTFHFAVYFVVTVRRKLVWRMLKMQRFKMLTVLIHVVMTYRRGNGLKAGDEIASDCTSVFLHEMQLRYKNYVTLYSICFWVCWMLYMILYIALLYKVNS